MTNDRSPDLIPVRALNQVSYCPRLYYLEYVDSVMPINEFVEDGLFQHRRVNDPQLANRTRKEGDVLRTRSVSLSSERLGITGKLDLLEEEGDAIRPVETKRSAAPKNDDGEPGFWENDAIQLCAQALLVEESQSVLILSPGHRRFRRPHADQQQHADPRRLHHLARFMPAHRRGPQDVFRGLRTAQSHGGHSSRLRLQNDLRPNARSSGQNALGACSRRHT